jgi:hypothetical protein
MNTANIIYKFATLRNYSDEVKSRPELEIQPRTNFLTSLIETIESGQTQPEKIASVNQKLEAFIKGGSFFKTKSELTAALGKLVPSPGKPQACGDADVAQERAGELQALYENLYDNIAMRTLTKGTTEEVYKLLTEGIKKLHLRLHGERLRDESVSKLKIILPERLILSFSPPAKTRRNKLVENTLPPLASNELLGGPRRGASESGTDPLRQPSLRGQTFFPNLYRAPFLVAMKRSPVTKKT